MSSSNCCFLTCIQVSQEAAQVVWYSHLLQNFPQFIVIHTVKGFGIVNKAEIEVFLELSCFFEDPADIGNLISGSSAFSKTSLNIWKFSVHVLLKPGNLRDLLILPFHFTPVEIEIQIRYLTHMKSPAKSNLWSSPGPIPPLHPELNTNLLKSTNFCYLNLSPNHSIS